MGNLRLQHPRLRVEIDGETGAFRSVVHPAAGLSLIVRPDLAAAHPFMVIMADGSVVRDWTACTVREEPDGAVRIAWTLDGGLRLEAHLLLDPNSGDLRCTAALRNPGALPVAALAYPYIAGIGPLGDLPADDELVHPYATGFLVRDPLSTLPPIDAETTGGRPVVLGLYPEGFSGSTMQFLAYSARGRGGFYLAAEDGEGREKWLNCYLHPDGDLRLAIWHGPVDYAGRREVRPPYTTVLAALDGGTWYDAADRYRAWALTQPWAARGPLWARADRPRWLLERVGLCTFGINPRHDRAPWLAEIDRIAGTPVLHLLGPNWPRAEANYHNHLPGGLADWFPARFHPANIAQIRAHGDFLVPFEFDLLFGRDADAADAAEGARALQVIPTPTLSRDAYAFPFLCPASPFTRALHVDRDRTLAAEYGVDGVYYDISVNNVRHICLSPDHGHAPGDTAAITAAYKTLLAETAAAMRTGAGGRPIVQGAEMINEQMLPYLDFYQARAEASPAAPFEANPFIDLIRRGEAEKIPLFAYVYHEYGPLRLDGWAKLSREQGDFVYFALGRVFIQGGLIELNYEFSALESLGDRHDNPDEHYFRFAERLYAIDPGLAAYVGALARARVGWANRYLAYGAMCRPAPLEVDGGHTLTLSYLPYNSDLEWDGYEQPGVITVPAILQGAWRYRDESIGYLLLNLAPEERTATIDVGPPPPGASTLAGREGDAAPPDLGAWTLTRREGDAAPLDLGPWTTSRRVALALPSRRPVLLEGRQTYETPPRR